MIHKAVLGRIRQEQRKDFGPFADKTDTEIYHLLFANLRKSTSGVKGLRLTHMGLTIMESCFVAWTLKLPKRFVLLPKHLLFFDRTCTMPWFLDTKILVLFEAELAMRAKLVGNIDHLLTAFTPIDS